MWISYALICTGMIAFNSLSFRWLTERNQPIFMIIFLFKVVAFLCFAVSLRSGIPTLSATEWGLIVTLGIFSNLGDVCQLLSIKLAPNPGYAQGIIFLYPVFVLFGSFLLPGMEQETKLLQLVGALLTVLGTIIIALPEKKAGPQ